MKFKFKVVTPYGIKFEEDIDRIQIRTTSGEIGVLANHINLVTEVKISVLRIHNDDTVKEFAISDGILYVKDKETVLIVNSAEFKEDIDFERASRAKERASLRLEKKDKNLDVARAEAALARALNRLSLKQ